MSSSDFRFHEPLRVRWSEIDAQKIVFNGHYLTYVDVAVSGYWRALALPYAAAMARLDGELYMRKATLDYLGSARYDELLAVGVRCSRIGRSSIAFDSTVFRRETPLVTCELVYVFADPATQTSRPVPDALRETLQAFEGGASMVEVRLGGWEAMRTDAQALRTSVFVDEQKVPLELELDAADAEHLHAVAYNRLGQALATGRLIQEAAGVARIGRMATLPAMRGSRIGRGVLDRLIEVARERGDREVRLSAQTTARGFYQRAGFTERGVPYDDAGLEHIEMVRAV